MVSEIATVADKSMFVQFIVEGSTPSKVATKANLDTWTNSLKVPWTIAIDPDTVPPFTIKTTYGLKETGYIIDRATRKILYKGNDTSTVFNKLKSMP